MEKRADTADMSVPVFLGCAIVLAEFMKIALCERDWAKKHCADSSVQIGLC